jgi:hypothetical protein
MVLWGIHMERRGYIYVLATAYQDDGGQQIIKIGRTSRSPAARVKELSRGGPTGIVLVGAVSCRDTVELEKRVHQHFHQSRFRSDGAQIVADVFGLTPAAIRVDTGLDTGRDGSGACHRPCRARLRPAPCGSTLRQG